MFSTRRRPTGSATSRGPLPARGRVGDRRAALAVLPLALALTTGCSVAQDVTQRAGDAAKTEASQAVASALQDQICAVVGDGRINQSDLAVLKALFNRASDAGLGQDFTGPVGDIVNNGAQATDSVDALQKQCRKRAQ
jgi:hypothetical protein